MFNQHVGLFARNETQTKIFNFGKDWLPAITTV